MLTLYSLTVKAISPEPVAELLGLRINLLLRSYHRIRPRKQVLMKLRETLVKALEKSRWIHSLQPLGSIPFGLAPVLEHLKQGEIMQPIRLGKVFCIVELVEYHNSQLDEATEEMLLAEQFRLWIDTVVDYIEANLVWPES